MAKKLLSLLFKLFLRTDIAAKSDDSAFPAVLLNMNVVDMKFNIPPYKRSR